MHGSAPRRWLSTSALLMALAGFVVLAVGAGAQGPAVESAKSAPRVLLVDLKGGIGPATTDHIERSLRRAADEGAAAVVLRIDTPGGLDAATRDINQAILASSVPVIGYVAPEGARAASAGTYILYATHLAAMAPATSLGAATPVAIGGSPGPGRGAPEDRKATGTDEASNHDSTPERDEAKGDATDGKVAPRPGEPSGASERKALNDAVAYLRSLAELRGRDLEFAEAAVRRADTLTASEALERGVIELVAEDLDDLLEAADGRSVRLHEGEVSIATAGAEVIAVQPDWRNRFLSVITEPSVAYLLLLAGLYGLVFEGYSPGAIVPGVVGAICLLLALYALQVLPVNYVGVALIVLGVALMVAELAAPSFGALGIGGVVALVTGSIILFDTEVPGFGVPGLLVLSVGFTSALGFLGVLYLAVRARNRPVVSGADELLGRTATVLEDFDGRGRVHLRGEDWQARCPLPLRAGDKVQVRAIEGLILQVEPAVSESQHPSQHTRRAP
jgi:membrane-bound serine protease (ClpP class)